MASSIEQVYCQAIDKANAHLSEYQRQRQMLADLVATQEETLERLSEEQKKQEREVESQKL